MINASVWYLFIAIGIGTFAIRLSFIQLYGRKGFNINQYERVFLLLAPAVLSALSIPAILSQGSTDLSEISIEKLSAAIVTGLLAWYFKGVFWPLILGMLTFWLIRYL
ncbi:AzlD domain-containing protein [Nitrincola nitratireducens]|uniref:Putative membrane protein n=1 Tax=Nitrincola nitratireducens TaxID=1229521 RepID=W9UZJ9_9GAMM|nr:AzlD domain-containing protein [Nitrincola nitratireducens]EXJ12494.1 putative membrane protein [Nitrincola nitratireducens]